jgi:hypothetical protein
MCASNLHQFALALGPYLDDFGGQRPTPDALVNGKYLTAKCLLCPEDKTGNWGGLIQATIALPDQNPPEQNQASVKYSYLLEPLTWDDAEWKVLQDAGDRAGVAACQLHGLGKQTTNPPPNIRAYSGLLLRAQLDASVIRRKFFWPPLGAVAILGSEQLSYSLQMFFDDPANWKAYQ